MTATVVILILKQKQYTRSKLAESSLSAKPKLGAKSFCVASNVTNDVMGFHKPRFITPRARARARTSNKAFISLRVACCAQVPTDATDARRTPKAI